MTRRVKANVYVIDNNNGKIIRGMENQDRVYINIIATTKKAASKADFSKSCLMNVFSSKRTIKEPVSFIFRLEILFSKPESSMALRISSTNP